jgi:NDP-sugar pyrophosphorylase family protein
LNQRTSGIILTAAKADITICEVFGDLPTGLIPVNGKPIIFFILQQMLENNILDVYIGVDYKQEKLREVVDLYFSSKLNIYYIYTDMTKAPGNSLLQVVDKVETEKVIVNLADTYIKNFNYKGFEDSIIVSDDYLDEERWATVELEDNKIKKFVDKQKIESGKLYAICGLYSFNNIKLFDSFVKDGIIELNDLLDFYNKNKKLEIKKTNEWLDFGHIDKYYISKKRLIQSRGFNSLEYDDLLGTITKRSKNIDKFIAEIQWQVNLPKNLQVLSPRVLDYSIEENTFITMEFYSYPTLAEVWLFSELNEKVYFSIIDKLFNILDLFQKNKKVVSYNDYKAIYISKTIERVEAIDNTIILKFLEQDMITINNKSLYNWKIIKERIFQKVGELYKEQDNCLIHGDFCLSNILYDLRNGIVRLIDPRGIWGSSENGDIKYDIAKLRHSICGDYDYIVNDLFKVNIKDSQINYSSFNSNKTSVAKYFDEKLSMKYNINHIKLIEGLLFLSMIALHEDNSQRQIAMYCKSIELLNEVL